MRLDVIELCQQRMKEFMEEVFKYRRAFANDGLLFTILFLFILGGMYYKQMIDFIPDQVPLPLILAVGLALILTMGRHRTFLKEADLLFLPLLERGMDPYFNKTLRYNLYIQCGGMLILLLMLQPLYEAKIPVEHQSFWFFLIIPILAKGWNVYSSWNMLRVPHLEKRLLHKGLRFVFNFALMYWFITGGTFLSFNKYVFGGLLLAGGVLGFYFYERRVCKTYAYPWIELIELEKKLLSRFYSFINMFVDVPQVSKKVLPRKWIAWITDLFPFQKKQAYLFLLIKTFLRTEEYSSRFIRLILVGMVLIWWIPNVYVKLALAAGFVYLTRSQLKGMKNYHQRQFWQAVFPWPKELLQSSFKKLSISLMSIQSLLFLLVILLTY